MTQKLLDRFPQSTVVGYDVSAEMLARARAKLARTGTRVQLHQGDISQIALPGPFDAASRPLLCTMCHPRPNLSCFIASGAALRPGGVLVLGDAFQPATPALGERYRQLTAEEFERQDCRDASLCRVPQPQQPAFGRGEYASPKISPMDGKRGLAMSICVWKHFARAVVYGERPLEA